MPTVPLFPGIEPGTDFQHFYVGLRSRSSVCLNTCLATENPRLWSPTVSSTPAIQRQRNIQPRRLERIRIRTEDTPPVNLAAGIHLAEKRSIRSIYGYTVFWLDWYKEG